MMGDDKYLTDDDRAIMHTLAATNSDRRSQVIPEAAVEIGYVCRHGHFQFIDDPDGDACGTKRVGTIYVKADYEVTRAELAEALGYSLESHHRKMEEWRAQ